jgi:hypothetical protein
MARTIIGVDDAKAIKKWSGMLAYDTSPKSYFHQRFMARGSEAEVPIQILTDLESDAGEQISYVFVKRPSGNNQVGGRVLWMSRCSSTYRAHAV